MSPGHATGRAAACPPGVLSVGAVSYLNARPLVEGLADRTDVRLIRRVPADLYALLDRGEVDVALLPVVDLWRGEGRLRTVSDACIASQAETLTVRVFSRRPPDRVERLHADPDSRTSVLLARVLWRDLYRREVQIVPLRRDVPSSDARAADADDADAVLLIGDKVVTAAPRGYGFEVDLGGAWRHLTGLPFVFAVWAGHAEADLPGTRARGVPDLSTAERLLASARDRGVARAAEIAQREAAAHGWPAALARRYLCETLSYTLTADMREAMARFRALANAAAPE